MAGVGQSGAEEDAPDNTAPLGERGEGRGSRGAAAADPLDDNCVYGREEIGAVHAHPGADVVVAIFVAVHMLGAEEESDTAAAAFDVGLPGRVVGGEREFGFVREGDCFAGPEAAVLPDAGVVGGGLERGVADMALHVGEVEEAAACHEGGGDAFAHFVIAFLGEGGAGDRAAGVGDVGEVGAGVLAGTLAVAVENPERGATPVHEAAAERGDEAGEGVDAGLLVVPPEPAVLGQSKEVLEKQADRVLEFHVAQHGGVWVEPGAEAFVEAGLRVDDLAVVRQVGHGHIEEAVDAGEALAEEPACESDAGVLLAHAFGEEDLVARLVFADDAGFDRALDGGDEFCRADRCEHLAGDRPVLVGLPDEADLDDLLGEAEHVEFGADEFAEVGSEGAVGTAERGEDDLRAAARAVVARLPDAQGGAAGGNDARLFLVRPLEEVAKSTA